MFYSWKFTLCIFSDDSNIDSLVSIFYGRKWIAQVNVGKKVKILIELMIVVIFSFDSSLRDHNTQQNTFIFLKGISLLDVFKSEIFNDIEFNRDVGCFKDINDTVYDKKNITGDFWADSDARDECYIVIFAILGSMGLSSSPDSPCGCISLECC